MSAPLPRPSIAPVALARVADAVGVPLHVGTESAVRGITHDSRTVRAGDLYAALPGHTSHGARFAAEAVAAGAVAVLTDVSGVEACASLGVPLLVVPDARAVLGAASAEVYGHPARELTVIGVTGTNGKTTTAAMVDAGIRASGSLCGLIGTTGVRVGEEWFAGARTTPEAPDLHAALRLMVDRGCRAAVMEVSSIAVAEGRVGDLILTAVGFTNLSQDHLDYHGSMDAYFAAKARLFTPTHALGGVVGVDDDWGRRLATEATIPVDTWSLTDPDADWSARPTAAGWQVIDPRGLAHPLRVGLPGDFNVANALCALGLLARAGVPERDGLAGIADAVVAGRMEVVADGAGVRGIVDYAHSPDAIARVIAALRSDTRGRLLVVLGAGGDRDRTKREAMGAAAASLADVVVVTDDNPRSEDPTGIRAQVRSGARNGRAHVHEEGDRAAAIALAVALAGPGDTVVVLGKGHEQGQEVAGTVTPFDDASVLRAALAAGNPG